MKFYDYVTFVILLTIVAVMFYWTLHWTIHHHKQTKVNYCGLRGFLKWGYQLRWNLTLFALALIIFNAATAPEFVDRPKVVTQINALFT